MIKGILLLADGFEETEAIASRDVMVRTREFEVTTVSISSSKEVVSSNGIHVISDALLNEINEDMYAFLMLPGGKRGVENLKGSPDVIGLVKRFAKEGKYLFAICAAPSILGELGLLDGKKYTCFPGFQKGNGEWLDVGAVADGKIITGHSMNYSVEWGELIVKELLGQETLDRIASGTKGIA